MKNIKKLLYVLILLSICSCGNYLPGFDFDNFKNTPLQELAEAVKEENADEISKIVKSGKIDIDYKEPKYGHSLLMLAVANNLYVSVNKLLELGANPNLKSDIRGDKDGSYIKTPMFIACDYILTNKNCDTEILNALISAGGDVNDKIEVEYVGANYETFETPLEEACKGECLNIVKTLLSSGAKLNDYDYKEGHGPLTNCIVHDRMEILQYLIIEANVNIPKYCYVVHAHNESPRKEYTITEMLLKKDYSKDSEEYRAREEILQFLKEKGLK